MCADSDISMQSPSSDDADHHAQAASSGAAAASAPAVVQTAAASAPAVLQTAVAVLSSSGPAAASGRAHVRTAAVAGLADVRPLSLFRSNANLAKTTVEMQADAFIVSPIASIIPTGNLERHEFGASASLDAMENFARTSRFDTSPKWKTFDRRELLLLTFDNWDIAERLYHELSLMCSAVGVGRAANGSCTAISLRKTTRISLPDDLSAAVKEGAAPLLNYRKRSKSDIFADVFQSWVLAQSLMIVNFSVLKGHACTHENILAEWAGLSEFHVMQDIHESKVSHRPTQRQAYLTKYGAELRAMLKSLESSDNQRVMHMTFDDPKIPSISDIEPAPSLIVLYHIDVDTHQVIRTSLRDWIRSGHLTRSLLVHGRAGMCKTPFSWAVASCLARLHPRADGSESRIWDVSDLEALPRDQLQTGDTICMQEFVASKPRGHNKAWPIDLLKIVIDSELGGDLPGKGTNSATTGVLVVPPRVARIMTTNKTPNEWHHLIPDNVDLADAAQLMELSDDAMAILKRLCFMSVREHLIRGSTMQTFRTAQVGSVAAVFDSVFTGANAIP
jgi:hypothetical protein